MSEETHERQFRGCWVSPEVFDAVEEGSITVKDAWLLVVIDSLVRSSGRDCFASNKYLADRIQVKSRQITYAITRLKKAGVLIETGFDGRRRMLRASYSKPTKNSGLRVAENCGADPQKTARLERGKLRGSPSPNIPLKGDTGRRHRKRSREREVETISAAAGADGVSQRGDPKSSHRFRKLFMRHWQEAYQGEVYPLNAREASIAKRIWDRLHHNMKKARVVLKAYFACRDRFFEGHSLGLLSNQLPKFLAGASSIQSMSPDSLPEDVYEAWFSHASKWLVPRIENEGKRVKAEDFAVVLGHHYLWRRRLYAEWETGTSMGHLSKKQFRPQTAASENPIQTWLESDMIRPYGEWIVEEVTDWDQWAGGLEKFLPGREHWRRYIDLITENWGGRVRKVFHACAEAEG